MNRVTLNTIQKNIPKFYTKNAGITAEFPGTFGIFFSSGYGWISEIRDIQRFSVSGRRLGFADTRGTLFHEIVRVAEARRPAYLLLENVPGLLNHENGQTFGTILAAIHELGYSLEWCVLNSAHFGVPQQRRRVY
ncbi:MAG: DNA (cytosine-5-)-methyltransferase, partial [Clostridia bacterium]|nr:DNA (cytosine-5-)-methyltransferase [Clostridia bacterium]